MLRAYKFDAGTFSQVESEDLKDQIDNVIWLDLFFPTDEEVTLVEGLFLIEVPTRDEMHEIEFSSRFYQINDALYTSLTKVTKGNTLTPESHVVTFVLKNNCLFTLRYADTHPFTNDLKGFEFKKGAAVNGAAIFLWMLDRIIDQLADLLEDVAWKLENLTQEIFSTQVDESDHKPNFKHMISSLGIQENLLSKCKESLFNLTRLLNFVIESPYFKSDDEQKIIHVSMRDLPPLIEHATFLSGKITFLLDSLLGMINIEQSTIIKVVSVAAVFFLPPTLIASIYGMNFRLMPELHWDFGYPSAIVLMLLAGLLPYAYFKYKKWL